MRTGGALGLILVAGAAAAASISSNIDAIDVSALTGAPVLAVDSSSCSSSSTCGIRTITAIEPAEGLFYLDGVLGPSALAALKGQFNASMLSVGSLVDGHPTMAVPAGVASGLATALRHRRTAVMVEAPFDDDEACPNLVWLPIQEHWGDFGNHKDHYHTADPDAERVVVQGQVGVMYLDGAGSMIFTHDATGHETAITVVPGRFIAWDNAAYTHSVRANDARRQILGPLTWEAAGQLGDGMLLGVCGEDTQSPTQGPITAEPSATPSQQPTNTPSSRPSASPIQQPTALPSQAPTGAPTPGATPSPTFSPPPPNVQSVGQGYVCGPEVYLQRRRLEVEREEKEQEAAPRALANTWTPETCYYACKARLNNPPAFVINIYYLEGIQTCTCCRRCEGLRYVPSAQVFAACTGPAGGLTLAAKARHARGGVKRGGKVVYAVRVRNRPTLEGIGLRVVLPAGVTFVGSATRPAIKGGPEKGTTAPVVTGSVVDWPAVPTPAKQKRVFIVVGRVGSQTPVGSRLVFSSFAYQSTPQGASFCDTPANNVTVTVKK